jgi:hypothetical protein
VFRNISSNILKNIFNPIYSGIGRRNLKASIVDHVSEAFEIRRTEVNADAISDCQK